MHHIDGPRADHDACGVGFIADRHRRASREWLDRGLEALARLAHRGATGDGVGSADGAGVLTAIPWAVYEPDLPAALRTAVTTRAAGMCFFPHPADDARTIVTRALAAEGWSNAHWRLVPIDTSCLGQAERATCPAVYQVFARADAPNPAWPQRVCTTRPSSRCRSTRSSTRRWSHRQTCPGSTPIWPIPRS